MQLEKSLEHATKKEKKRHENKFKSLKKEFALLESTGKLTRNHKMLKEALETITSASVGSKRAFSAAA